MLLKWNNSSWYFNSIQFNHNMLPTELLNLFVLNSVVSSQHTRNVCNEGLFIVL